MASGSSMQVGKVPEALPSHSTPQIKSKGKETAMIPKRRSMRILQTRFSGTRKGNDDGSDEDVALEPGFSTHEQESIRSTSGMDEVLDEDQYYSHDEGTYPDSNTHLEEPDASYIP
ncbi:unnamed protein product [Prunus brigantina]